MDPCRGPRELLSDTDRISALLTESGIWGPLVYVAVFSLLEPAGVPGTLFIVPASLVWPLWLAFLLSWAGSIGAGVVGFGFARSLGRDWVQARLPDRLRGYDQRLAERGLTTVIVVRLSEPAPFRCMILATTRRLATFMSRKAIETVFMLGSSSATPTARAGPEASRESVPVSCFGKTTLISRPIFTSWSVSSPQPRSESCTRVAARGRRPVWSFTGAAHTTRGPRRRSGPA